RGTHFITFGGSGGMASRKTAAKGRKLRAGLRSQMKKATVEDLAWNLAETTEEEEVMVGLHDTSKKSRSSRTEPVTPVATAGEGMVSLMRQYLDAQQQREERYLQELQGLRKTILQSTQHTETLSVSDSPRMALLTPAAQRVTKPRRSAHDRDSSSVPGQREPMQRTEPKMPTFQQGEDIENYLRRFKRLARTWRLPEEEWSYHLVPLLTRQALEAYLAMDEEQAEVYEDLKEALLEKFNISPETYRQRLEHSKEEIGEAKALGSVRESLTTFDVTVNGHSLQALLDTGCSMSMLKSCYVTNVDYLNTASVQCVHGDVKRYPRAEVLVEVQDQMYLLNVAIVDSLPMDMILGQDLPVLNDLLQATAKDSANVATATETPVNLSCPAITRSQARAGLQPLPDFDDSLLQGFSPCRVSLTHLQDIKHQELQHLLDQFPALFCQRPQRTELIQRPYRVPERLVEPLRKETEMMKELGVIESSMSEWCSPVISPKKDGSLHVSIDFRKLNAQSQFDTYLMQWVDDLLEKIGRAKYITTLDLCKGYWQVPLQPTSRPYTAFRTPMGLKQFTVLPFGLHGAPATFQRLMDRVLQGCEEWSAAYLDDVVIHSNSWQEHLQHLRQTLKKITEAGLTLNIGKCEWARQEASYLGYHLDNGQLCPQVNKVEAIRQSPRPKMKKEVRPFLGLVGWYRWFVPNLTSIAAPLTNLLKKSVANPIQWNKDCKVAFKTLKEKMCSSPVLQSPAFTQSFLVQVDASAIGLGAVLVQGTQGNEKPVVYFSRKLLPRETRYSEIEKECLAIKWALESSRYYLLRREFSLETDHRALTWLHSLKDHNARVMRWYLSLQPYNSKIRHRPGRLNLVADYLSRFPA
ncbi:hypothetical protein M9458_008017, partial [Cirrhinus mrigala]